MPTSFIVVFPRVYKVIGLPPPFLRSEVPQRLLLQVPLSIPAEPRVGFERRSEALEAFLEWLLPLLVQVLVAGPLHHPPLLTSQNMTSTTKSWVDQ